MHAGVLLHITSLPGARGIGELGADAVRFLDWLRAAGCGWWQILPLGPTGYADSPYQPFSSFAGNPYLIDLADLVELELLRPAEIQPDTHWEDNRVDYATLIPWKLDLLASAWDRFAAGGDSQLAAEFTAFTAAEAGWLADFARYMAVKKEHGDGSWADWPRPLRRRRRGALRRADRRLSGEMARHTFHQFLFHRQWSRLRKEAAARNIRIIGDIPIFVAHDSADVWARPELFQLDGEGRPTVVAGVPPDSFTEEGQLWGNPLYDWPVHQAEGYAWWISRLQAVLRLVDLARIDHFRGFVNYWNVPATADHPSVGEWVDGPGKGFFDAVATALGGLPIIAEDLGEFDPRVPALRDELGLPGMKVLQSAFNSDDGNEFLPHLYPANCVVYTGTHDYDTAAGWWATAAPAERTFAKSYLGVDGKNMAWDLVTAAWRSRAEYAIAPVQDIAGLGSEARMNRPGTSDGNWQWRATWPDLSAANASRLQALNMETGRSAG